MADRAAYPGHRIALDALEDALVRSFDDGEAGLAVVASHPPNVVLLNVIMPVVDGFEVTRQTRRWSGLSITIPSARGRDGDKIVAVDLGAGHDLTKPYSVYKLLSRLPAVLRRSAPGPDRVVTHRQLLERVWGAHAASSAPQLRFYVHYLRRKLEDDPANPTILATEAGAGSGSDPMARRDRGSAPRRLRPVGRRAA